MQRPRIVVTGLGGICALGLDAPAIWKSMIEGSVGIAPLTTVPLHDLKQPIAGAITSLPEHLIDRRRIATMDRFSKLAVIAAGEALRDAGLAIEADRAPRSGAVIGTGVCGWEAIEDSYRAVLLEGKSRTGVFAVPRAMPGAAAGQVSMVCGLKGPVFGVTSACSSSNHAIIAAADQIRAGRADIMLAGGAEAPLVYGIMKAWEGLRVLSRDACRPFSADRDGLALGEGAGVLVLETLDHARQRGATILAELAGGGFSADASDIVAPTVEGPVAAMSSCLADAGLDPADIAYINAHGTGTKANDRIETAAIRTVFGDSAQNVSVSSTKSMHGHCLGASGAIEAIACIGAIRNGIVPPTMSYRASDPECDLDVTPNAARERRVDAALSNSFAFGGTNAVVAFTRFEA